MGTVLLFYRPCRFSAATLAGTTDQALLRVSVVRVD